MEKTVTTTEIGSAELSITVIQPRSGWRGLGLGEVLEFRELLWVLAARNIKVRYKQTFFGAAWAVIQPFATMVVFSIFFGRLAGIDQRIGAIPYPIFAYAALVPWTYFSQSISSQPWRPGLGRNAP